MRIQINVIFRRKFIEHEIRSTRMEITSSNRSYVNEGRVNNLKDEKSYVERVATVR